MNFSKNNIYIYIYSNKMKFNKINKIIIIIIILIVLIVLIGYLNNKKDLFTNNNSVNEIPKIIHQTAPANKDKWHKDWFKCQESWKKHFPDFEYKMWTDEDNENLIKTDYPWFLDTYTKYENKINRIDIVRYFILDKYGGIYADMDYICIKNFYNELPKDKVSISESPYKENEIIQNALMCSPKKHSFWMKVITEGKKRWDNNDNRDKVLYIAGPQLVSKIYEDNKDDVNVLPFNKYNPKKNTDEFNNDNNLFTKHFFTNTWV